MSGDETARKQRARSRYSIGEWYGLGFERLNPGKWQAMAQAEVSGAEIRMPCPFSDLSSCNKKGGICSLRRYEQATTDAPVVGAGPIITTCPARFSENGTIFQWVGETLLGTTDPIVLGEIGFLDRLRPLEPSPEEESRDFIGRIDNVLIHPEHRPLDWCALELQAVYFSGKAMTQEFKLLANESFETVPFPAAHRRPDWRSSGPKRLLPQLQTKVPTIRTWGKKMAVVIDEAFFGSLVGLEPERHLSNAEIVWFVVRYVPTEDGWTLTRHEVVPTRLESSVKALTGGTPLSRERFEAELRRKIGSRYPSHPLAGRS